jgi:hypothetical protein
MNLERIGPAPGYIETPKMKADFDRLLERLVISTIVEFDKRYNWPAIEKEQAARMHAFLEEVPI